MHRQLLSGCLSLPLLQPSLKPFAEVESCLLISLAYGTSFITGISVSVWTSMVSTYVSQIQLQSHHEPESSFVCFANAELRQKANGKRGVVCFALYHTSSQLLRQELNQAS